MDSGCLISFGEFHLEPRVKGQEGRTALRKIVPVVISCENCHCSVSQLCPTLCDPMDYSTPGFPVFTIFWSLLKLMSIKSVMPFNHLILCCPLLLLPSNFPVNRVFSSESALCIRWPKVLELQLQHQSFQ